jgi:23S rRNA-/tRNA-specific pseudouridylate synthase
MENGVSYYVEDKEKHLLRCQPYLHSFDSTVKGRWQRRTLLDVFVKEFTDRTKAYYEIAIARGLIRVNGEVAHNDTILKNGDWISHLIHYHEPPVALEANKIPILYSSSDMLVINKPGSVPVHPTGRYRYTSVVELLKAQYPALQDQCHTLNPINRLDRLTSGVCIFATTPKKAEELHALMREKEWFRKEYIARVYGVFPSNLEGLTTAIQSTTWKDHLTIDEDTKEFVCRIPLTIAENKIGAVIPDAMHGKDAVTYFSLLGSNGSHSLVRCRPVTGRTHQIRVHLDTLGYPIVYDPLYGEEAKTRNHPSTLQGKILNRRHLTTQQHQQACEGNDLKDDVIDREVEERVWLEGIENLESLSNEELVMQCCQVCHDPIRDPYENELYLCLHAYQYATPEMKWEGKPWPSWATELVDKQEIVS